MFDLFYIVFLFAVWFIPTVIIFCSNENYRKSLSLKLQLGWLALFLIDALYFESRFLNPLMMILSAVLVAWGARAVMRAWRNKNHFGSILGAAFLALISVGLGDYFFEDIYFSAEAQEAATDYKPSFVEADIIGTWKKGDSVIQFNSNHSVHLDVHESDLYISSQDLNVSGEGKWHRDGNFDIEISDDDGKVFKMSVVKIFNTYHFIRETSDPDGPRDSGFEKQMLVEK